MSNYQRGARVEIQAMDALGALAYVYQSMAAERSSGDEWASEWLGETWTHIPAALRMQAGDTNAAEELSQLQDCPVRNGLHCDHYQDGDGACCACGRPNWCPDKGEPT